MYIKGFKKPSDKQLLESRMLTMKERFERMKNNVEDKEDNQSSDVQDSSPPSNQVESSAISSRQSSVSKRHM
jgi:hypothetical protein